MGGRKKGTPNKFTTVKAAFLEFMERQDGVKFIEKVAKTERGRIAVLNTMGKLLPQKTELTGEDGGPIKLNVNVNVNLVKSKKVE